MGVSNPNIPFRYTSKYAPLCNKCGSTRSVKYIVHGKEHWCNVCVFREFVMPPKPAQE